MALQSFSGTSKRAWKLYETGLSLYDQIGTLPSLKKARPSLESVYSQTLQNVAVRVDLAFQAFFRRVKNGEKPGYPRFKGKGQYSSITFPQWNSGCDLTGNGLRLSKVGTVPIVLHRPVEGQIKTCTILRSSTGKWWAMFPCENVTENILPSNPLPVGIDVGIKTFAALSDGTIIENPKFLKRSAKRIAQAQRKLELQKNGSPERNRAKKIVAKVHERVAFRRTNFAHQESRKIVNQYGRIFVEDITVNDMNSHRCLNRSIRDVAWSQFFLFLSYKAESAGREFRRVNPAYTSQTCSSCGHRQKMPLSDRTYRCPCCGMEKDRDLNASLNILRLGLESRGYPPEAPAFTPGSSHVKSMFLTTCLVDILLVP